MKFTITGDAARIAACLSVLCISTLASFRTNQATAQIEGSQVSRGAFSNNMFAGGARSANRMKLAEFAARMRNRQSTLGPQWSGKQTPELRQLQVDGVERRYYLYRPAGSAGSAPLVLAFHGGGGKAEGTDRSTGGLAKLADEKGFIVAYPDAIEKHWNDERKGLSKAQCDDVAFIAKLIDDLTAEKLIDPKRVYATGISNGGFFSQFLAMQLPGRIAAVASVAASVSTKAQQNSSAEPIPILMLLGTEDPLVPYAGGNIGGKLLHGRGQVLSEAQSELFWLKRNKNTSKAQVTQMADANTEDGCHVTVRQYGAPGSSNEVVVYDIRGGGHTWPSGTQYLPRAIVGPVCRDFDGNRTIWNFFERHLIK
jgi:polyhydroxybutyrate depolymerase